MSKSVSIARSNSRFMIVQVANVATLLKWRKIMIGKNYLAILATLAIASGVQWVSVPAYAAAKEKDISLRLLGHYQTPTAGGAIEISAYDKFSKRVFSVNSISNTVEVIDLSDPTNPTNIAVIAAHGVPNSVAINNGRVAVASEASPNRQDNGNVTFYDAATLAELAQVEVGAVPDMITFTPNGQKLLVANEGEPANNYADDPEGSVSIIDIPQGGGQDYVVRTVRFDGTATLKNAASIRHYGPEVGTCAGVTPASAQTACFAPAGGPTYAKASFAQDMEPEYITVSEDGHTAWVTLQENNAIATLDLDTETFIQVAGLGFKDWAGSTMDASDRDGPGGTVLVNNRKYWPGVRGIYQPDSIGRFKSGGTTYLVTANEGDAREWGNYVELVRARSLCPTGNPASANCQISASWAGWNNCALPPCYGTTAPNGVLADANLGRLNVTSVTGRNGAGKFDDLYALGGRSFSVWSTDGDLVFDSGGQMEQIVHDFIPGFENANQTSPGAAKDERSDDKGPEPEGLAMGKVWGRNYAFIGLERIGGVMVFDVDNPTAPRFVTYVNNRVFTPPNTSSPSDLGPEGLTVLDADNSPTHSPLLLVSNEISGTLAIYAIDKE